MSDDMLWILLMRMAERVLAVCIGGISIYFGFRLFVLMPDQPIGDADIKLPGGVSIVASRIGPGIFFSLFGAVIASLSLYKPVELPVTNIHGSVVTASAAVSEGKGALAHQETERSAVQRKLADLQDVINLIPPDTAPHARNDAMRAVEAGRVALIYSVWGEDWGNFQEFKNWAQLNNSDPPSGVPWAPAAKMFNWRNPS